MNENSEPISKPFDREAKIILLNALKRGYFDPSDVFDLEKKGCFEKAFADPYEVAKYLYGFDNENKANE